MLIYVLFRTSTLFLFKWIDFLNLEAIVFKFRNNFNFIINYLHPSILYSLPDALWLFSFINMIMLLNYKSKYFYLLVPLCFSFVPEFLQYFKLFKGTFDILDIIYCLIFLIFNLLIFLKYFRKHQYK
ncbi:hypothetical protein AS589_03275 [Empedobacter brevis]|nr:hypothetical protein AS589_03275 [Empedobacter brevis]